MQLFIIIGQCLTSLYHAMFALIAELSFELTHALDRVLRTIMDTNNNNLIDN